MVLLEDRLSLLDLSVSLNVGALSLAGKKMSYSQCPPEAGSGSSTLPLKR